ncbi:valyl-tRNA synthetase [Beauveria bassiana ARSEF 2860]|uniref:Valine--tRNA ligase, mitochondrial n=1 Tax=Beauveria bassiana (strain ARSEF 2860) TaxID=655819 RepID=J5K2B5_BEAB2|nr:valyl-tRNA synthetase [Beauveria bassiana ARSEF 2860]EJP70548.1 valyl-tRNA synthetase [Beauveria bassiana ARSEF 2860]
MAANAGHPNIAEGASVPAQASSAKAPGSEAPKVKTEKELEKERQKAEKAAKLEAKKAKAALQAANAAANKEKKAKKEKADEPEVPPYVEDTPPGEKKRIRSFEDPNFKAYDPIAVESAWYTWWEKEGFFKPEFKPNGDVKDEGSFVIVHPPPNVTGALHMGHALTDSLQDMMIRWSRMHGKTTLWLPGTDHAGISTQSVVENMLWRRKQQTRHDLGREKFIETVWEWKEDYHQRINKALTRLGGSFDWSREAFTMDESRYAAVVENFVRLHEEGIIYRANRLVNWCTRLNTALSNLEVDNKELTGRTLLEVPGYDKKVEFGVIVHFKYPIEGSDETVEVATTRIETMLGDTGIAVHPKDTRYTHLIGKNAVHPFIPNRKLPIVADEYVEMDFGTGAVKLTPAHDANDFALGQRHKLEFINILNDDGLMNENAGPFKGQKRFDVRYSIQEALKEKGLYVDKKDNAMKVPMCSKSKDVIEPLMKPQWWVKMKDMASEAAKVVKNGEIKIRPESAEKAYYRWMEDIQDWCISRQLWWGHRCPVYFAKVEGGSDLSEEELWFSGRTKQEAEAKASAKLPGKKFTLEQDEDVLDTWFSSGLWPFSTLGWPKKTHDLEKLFPTTILETGWDILFFWIARMIMLSLKLTGKIPFEEVFCHSLVRDSEGRKMSKSLGNVIDPLDVISGIPLQTLHDKLALGNLHPTEVERATKYQKTSFPDGIPQCGADALRFTMINATTGGSDINLEIRSIYGYRKFCNKIFQATKYVLGSLPADFVPSKHGAVSGKTLAERWILHKMNQAAKEVNVAIADREFSKSTAIVYKYWYSELCDVYIENSKSIIRDGTPEERDSAIQTLYTALEAALTMIHPFMPFISEEMWQRMPRRPSDETKSIMIAKYPVYSATLDDPQSETAYELVLDCVKAARSLTSEYAIKENADVIIQTFTDAAEETCTKELLSITSLAGKAVNKIKMIGANAPRPAGCVAYPVSTAATVFLQVKGRVDMDAEIAKAQKRRDKATQSIQRQEKLLADPVYLQKASEAVRDADEKKLADAKQELASFEATIMQFVQLKLE